VFHTAGNIILFCFDLPVLVVEKRNMGYLEN
jgi:hypothetical protein